MRLCVGAERQLILRPILVLPAIESVEVLALFALPAYSKHTLKVKLLVGRMHVHGALGVNILHVICARQPGWAMAVYHQHGGRTVASSCIVSLCSCVLAVLANLGS